MVRLGLVTYTAINMLRAKTLPTVLQSRRAYDFSVQEVVLIRQKCSEYWFLPFIYNNDSSSGVVMACYSCISRQKFLSS